MLVVRDGFEVMVDGNGYKAIVKLGGRFEDSIVDITPERVTVYPDNGWDGQYFGTIQKAHEFMLNNGIDSPWEYADASIGMLDEYQQLAARTLALNPARTPLSLEQCALELASESGEAIGEIKRLNRLTSGSEYRPGKCTADELRERIADEIGDVLWAVAAISTALNFPLAEIAERNINKLRERVPAAFADTNNTPDEV